MVQFTRLRLTGFKSFVEPTEFIIEDGLTGVVGPNGCGKSNLLEGMRWAMGETAPKKLRGGEMDDIIFGGSADRPARNIAEVAIHLDNSDRGAPAAFNDSDTIEVVRRIERGAGSTFRINGKEVRARDVQLVFADASSGARSTALVSQGRVGALINAKPTDRRGVLEEAAGITGLHSRRHEAELRLRAAETNLDRLDDVIGTYEIQLKGLKRQARQATRYRNISDHIRKAESILLHLRWKEASAELEAARARLAEIGTQVTEQTRHVSEATRTHGEAADGLPALRQAEAEAAAELHRLNVAREQLDAEEQRVNELRLATEARLEQVDRDAEREKTLAADAETMLAKLTKEQAEIEAARAGEEESWNVAAARVAEAEAAVTAHEARYSGLAEKIAADEARRSDITRLHAEAEARVERLKRRVTEIAEERVELESGSSQAAAVSRADAAVVAADEKNNRVRQEASAAEEARNAAEAAAEAAHATLQDAEAALAKLSAEAGALNEILQTGEPEVRAPILDAVAVEPGFETALGAALGDDLAASAEEGAALHWRKLPPLADQPELPAGAEPLNSFVRAPSALARRLSQIGVVADAAVGARLQADLAQGQRLVTRDGALWRWDGYVVAAAAITTAGKRLAQRNRLDELTREIEHASTRTAAARETADATRKQAAEARTHEQQARATANQAAAALVDARNHRSEQTERAATAGSRLVALAEMVISIETELTEGETALAARREEQAGLTDPEADRPELDRLREALAEQRAILGSRQHEAENLRREAKSREYRLTTINSDTDSWRARAENAAAQRVQLGERRQATEDELGRLASLPREIEQKRNALMDTLESSEARRRALADRLAEAEARAAEFEKKLRAAEASLADLREARGLAEGALKQAEQAVGTVAERVAERLKCAPEDALAAGGVKEDETLPDVEASEIRVSRLLKERDNMGPVNLRADEEARELDVQIETLQGERDELIAAIGKFRTGIAELNREGRDRLVASFEEVDRHFREVFQRLFGGGRAHLTLVESDDPLDAGLEIMASPPGKRLQVLSLLSGGEQALTALALLFSVFLTNPAPICVLDEVDAPLDDANVDRFCSLLEHISHSSSTRFILITHHRMSMARMDRLFGVTMPERGVSQLVSVDLQSAEALRETA